MALSREINENRFKTFANQTFWYAKEWMKTFIYLRVIGNCSRQIA